jgi:hypothetical protein
MAQIHADALKVGFRDGKARDSAYSFEEIWTNQSDTELPVAIFGAHHLATRNAILGVYTVLIAPQHMDGCAVYWWGH